MTMSPKQWLKFHDRVLDCWKVFTANFNSDTGGLWNCADSGISPYSTEAERLRVLSVAHSPSNLVGTPAADTEH